jgi:hypothetical protein
MPVAGGKPTAEEPLLHIHTWRSQTTDVARDFARDFAVIHVTSFHIRRGIIVDWFVGVTDLAKTESC